MRSLSTFLLCYLCLAQLILSFAALQPFYIYEGPVYTAVTHELIDCWRLRSGRDLPPWSDRLLGAESLVAIWLHRALLDHPARTLNPELASLFFVPAFLDLFPTRVTCNDATIQQLSANFVTSLKQSPWFQRFGGSDHMLISAGWINQLLFRGADFDLLSRMILGNLEPGTPSWSMWGCAERVVALPYVARSTIDLESARRPPSQRNTTFFFRGSSKDRPERLNLAAIGLEISGSNIHLQAKTMAWDRRQALDSHYVQLLLSSRFCFAPRGDTPSSRRLFDAAAAGCIPILPELLRSNGDLPFARRIPYESLAVFVPDDVYASPQGLLRVAKGLALMPLERLDAMHSKLMEWRDYFAVARGGNDTFESLEPSPVLATAFLEEAAAVVQTSQWSCTAPNPETAFESEAALRHSRGVRAQNMFRAKRLSSSTFPAMGRRDEWLSATETTVIEDSALLMCDVPSAGGAPLFQAIAEATDTPALPLPIDSPQSLGTFAYRDCWVQVRVVRDPVVRLWAAFLEREVPQLQARLRRGALPSNGQRSFALNGEFALEFQFFVAQLAQAFAAGQLDKDRLYRPQAAYCGARYRPFAATLRHEALKVDGELFLRSLGLWEEVGSASWAALLDSRSGSAAAASRAADELFAGCGWTAYFDERTLDLVAKVYGEDYVRHPWYSTGTWLNARKRCKKPA